MSKYFTVVWLLHGNPVVTRITLGPNEHASGYDHDTWLAHALVTYWAEPGNGGGTWDDALLFIDDVGPALAAVFRSHIAPIWEP